MGQEVLGTEEEERNEFNESQTNNFTPPNYFETMDIHIKTLKVVSVKSPKDILYFPNFKKIVVASPLTIHLIDIDDLKEKKFKKHKNEISCLCKFNDSSFLSSSRDKTVMKWEFDGNGGEKVKVKKKVKDKESIGCILKTSDNEFIYGSLGPNAYIQFMTFDKFQKIKKVVDKHGDSYQCFHLLQNLGKKFFVAAGGSAKLNSIKIYDAQERRKVGILTDNRNHVGAITSLSSFFHTSSDREIVVSGGCDGMLMFWDVQEHKKLKEYRYGESIFSLYYVPPFLTCQKSEEMMMSIIIFGTGNGDLGIYMFENHKVMKKENVFKGLILHKIRGINNQTILTCSNETGDNLVKILQIKLEKMEDFK